MTITQTLLTNLTYIGVSFGVFAICVIANIIIKTYFNTAQLHQQFSLSRLFEGIKKMLAIGITTSLLAIVVTLIPSVPYLDSIFTEDVAQVFSLGSIFVLYGNAILKYFTAAHATTKDILENRNIIEDVGFEHEDGR